jgi:hypothetical protein
MNKLAMIAVATALSASAGGVFAAQPFGRDSVYVQPGQVVTSTAPKVEIARLGRDSVYVTKDTALSKPASVKVGAVVTRPGRA